MVGKREVMANRAAGIASGLPEQSLMATFADRVQQA
jgi:hypothetical protein